MQILNFEGDSEIKFRLPSHLVSLSDMSILFVTFSLRQKVNFVASLVFFGLLSKLTALQQKWRFLFPPWYQSNDETWLPKLHKSYSSIANSSIADFLKLRFDQWSLRNLSSWCLISKYTKVHSLLRWSFTTLIDYLNSRWIRQKTVDLRI